MCNWLHPCNVYDVLMKTKDSRIFPPHTHTQLLRIRFILFHATESDVNQKLGKTHTCYCCLAWSSAGFGTCSSADFAEMARGQMWLPPPPPPLLPSSPLWTAPAPKWLTRAPFTANENTPCLLCIQWPRAIGLRTCYCKPPRVPLQISPARRLFGRRKK